VDAAQEADEAGIVGLYRSRDPESGTAKWRKILEEDW